MRSPIGTFVLLLLGACGGGDSTSLTDPPAGKSFTLTIGQSGSGAGQIVTTSGITPAIDCQVSSGGAATGRCSGSYSEGSSISFTITPGATTAFISWTADAASCHSALTCSLTMTQNQKAVAQLALTQNPGFKVGGKAVRR
jgi:Divergent InlB B-repeat domain